MNLTVLPDSYAVCRLSASGKVPSWCAGPFVSVTRTASELSIVCEEAAVPEAVRREGGWRVLRVEGPIPFEMTGVAASLLAPLAAARISIFLISTFDTDYLMVKEESLQRAITALRKAAFVVQ